MFESFLSNERGLHRKSKLLLYFFPKYLSNCGCYFWQRDQCLINALITKAFYTSLTMTQFSTHYTAMFFFFGTMQQLVIRNLGENPQKPNCVQSVTYRHVTDNLVHFSIFEDFRRSQ